MSGVLNRNLRDTDCRHRRGAARSQTTPCASSFRRCRSHVHRSGDDDGPSGRRDGPNGRHRACRDRHGRGHVRHRGHHGRPPKREQRQRRSERARRRLRVRFYETYVYLPFARRDCLMRSSDAPRAEIVRNIFLNSHSGKACKHWVSCIHRRSGVSWITDEITPACRPVGACGDRRARPANSIAAQLQTSGNGEPFPWQFRCALRNGRRTQWMIWKSG